MKTQSSRFDSLVARYYPAVYSCASRLTDDPREAIVLTRDAFNVARKQLRNLRDQTAVAKVLISAVIRAGLTVAQPLGISRIFGLIWPLRNGLRLRLQNTPACFPRA